MSKKGKIKKRRNRNEQELRVAFANEYALLCGKYNLCIVEDNRGNPRVSEYRDLPKYLYELELTTRTEAEAGHE